VQEIQKDLHPRTPLRGEGTAVQEKRRLPRTRVNKSAKISFQNQASPVHCIVSDLNSGGACLDFALQVYASNWFDLSFDNFRTKRVCWVAWQQSNKLGVCFC
jgi:PilZ domain